MNINHLRGLLQKEACIRWSLGLSIVFCVACKDTRTDAPRDAGHLQDAATNMNCAEGAYCPDDAAVSGADAELPDAETDLCPELGAALPTAQAPLRRGDMAVAFDPLCQRMYMVFGDKAEPANCGSAASDFLVDAAVYDVQSQRWYEIPLIGTVPRQRARSRAVWDAQRARLILFGGRYRVGTTGPYQFLNDVWAFDPMTGLWAELTPTSGEAPSGRMNFSFTADPVRDRILLHAGGVVSGVQYAVDAQTWAFDLATSTWSQLGLNNPPPARLFHVAGVDSARGRLFVFGGGGEDAFTNPMMKRDLYYLDFALDTWTQVPGPAGFPSGRIKAEMITDTTRDRLILFAGHDDTALGNSNDVWIFDLASLQWSQEHVGDTFNRGALAFCEFPGDFAVVDLNSPERRESHAFVSDGEQLAVLYGGRTDCGLANDTWHLDLQTLAWTQITVSPNGMTCVRNGNANCSEPTARMCD